MIKLNNITKRFGHKTVLNVKNLEIKKACITGIIGPNGSGKTTLLKIIAGVLKASSGEVELNYMDKASEMSVTYVPQDPYLFNMTTLENIIYPLRIRKVDNQEAISRGMEYINLFNLQEVKDQNGQTLSSGEKQKTSLARALIFQPEILLLDEPLSNIDEKSSRFISDYLIKYQREHASTIIYVSHDGEQVERLCHVIETI